MADNNPNLPSGAGSVPPTPPTGATLPVAAKPSESGKIQPKKETVRINLPPKPTAAPTIKIPAPSAIHAAAPAAGATVAPSAAAPAAPRAAVPAGSPAAAPVSAAAAPRPIAPPTTAGRPAAAPRYSAAGGGYDTVDKVLAITAAVVSLVALLRVLTL
ncbi:MAG: hypothetical protein ACXW32_00635 [Limisphaerales bacterium]